MNKKNILIVLVSIIIIFILIDLLFNFSGNMMENFVTFNNNNKPKSVVSKLDGKVFNIFIINEIFSDSNKGNEIYIPSPKSIEKNIGLDEDGTLKEFLRDKSDNKQKWYLFKINNRNDLIKHLRTSKLGLNTNNNCTSYPFYIIKSKNWENWALQYNNGKLTCRPIGNYNSQKWDISEYSANYGDKDICYSHCNEKSDYGETGLNDADQKSNSDKIKLNFNLNENLTKLLNQYVGNSNSNNNNNNDQDVDIPKSVISNICPGCSFE